MSSIHFAIQSVLGTVTTSVVGNMGAPLRTGEFDEPDADPEEIRFSKDPFNFGLVPEADAEGQDDMELSRMEGGTVGKAGTAGRLHED